MGGEKFDMQEKQEKSWNCGSQFVINFIRLDFIFNSLWKKGSKIAVLFY